MKELLIKIFGKKLLYNVRKAPAVNFLPRLWHASSFYNYRYRQILKWGFQSREDTNFTYLLTDTSILYLASTLNVVTNAPVQEIMGYIQEVQTNQALRDHILQKTRESAYKLVADERVEFGRRLGWYALVRIMKPRVVVETGVDKGLGAVLLCAALLRNRTEGHPGQYYGTDIAPKAGYLLDAPYTEVGKVLYGDSIESLTKLEKPIDLFINDSDHSAEYEYREYQTIKDNLGPQAIILGDNSHETDKLAKFSLEAGRRFLYFHEFPSGHWYPGGGIGISFIPA